MREEKSLYIREFLNQDEGLALVEAQVSEMRVHRHEHEGTEHVSGNVDASFTIGDCSRRSTLDFSVYDEEDIALREEKLARLKKGLADFESNWRMQVKRFRKQVVPLLRKQALKRV